MEEFIRLGVMIWDKPRFWEVNEHEQNVVERWCRIIQQADMEAYTGDGATPGLETKPLMLMNESTAKMIFPLYPGVVYIG